jgi:hypothetical protein
MRSVDGGAHRIAEQSKLAEERPSPQPNRRRFDVHLHFAVGDEVHAIAGLGAPDDDGPCRHLQTPQVVRDFGNSGWVKRLEERHLGHEVPSLNEIAPPALGSKTGGQDTGPQAKRGDAANHDQGAEQMAQIGYRYLVAVAGRRQRDHRPPQHLGQRAEGDGLHGALYDKHG